MVLEHLISHSVFASHHWLKGYFDVKWVILNRLILPSGGVPSVRVCYLDLPHRKTNECDLPNGRIEEDNLPHGRTEEEDLTQGRKEKDNLPQAGQRKKAVLMGGHRKGTQGVTNNSVFKNYSNNLTE